MKWITREKVKVDRVACPWFIRKFIDPKAELVLLGEIVRAADSHPSQPHPAGEGLRWVAHGFSALGLSDAQILEREFVVYDALYAECQRKVKTVG
jgi:hypothetical protein